jgi:hypothetical protein
MIYVWAPNCTPKDQADIDAGTVATRGSRIEFVPPAMSALGHEVPFQRPRLNGRCRLRKRFVAVDDRWRGF